MNLHGYLAQNGIAYESDEALDFANTFFAAVNYWTLRRSMELARGYVIEPANEIPPSEVKKAATGSGTASKEEVEIGVRKWLGLSDDYVFETDDESDAVAVGLAWLIREGHIEREA